MWEEVKQFGGEVEPSGGGGGGGGSFLCAPLPPPPPLRVQDVYCLEVVWRHFHEYCVVLWHEIEIVTAVVIAKTTSFHH